MVRTASQHSHTYVSKTIYYNRPSLLIFVNNSGLSFFRIIVIFYHHFFPVGISLLCSRSFAMSIVLLIVNNRPIQSYIATYTDCFTLSSA